jgi:hypothetical protein
MLGLHITFNHGFYLIHSTHLIRYFTPIRTIHVFPLLKEAAGWSYRRQMSVIMSRGEGTEPKALSFGFQLRQMMCNWIWERRSSIQKPIAPSSLPFPRIQAHQGGLSLFTSDTSSFCNHILACVSYCSLSVVNTHASPQGDLLRSRWRELDEKLLAGLN